VRLSQMEVAVKMLDGVVGCEEQEMKRGGEF
jgi:hypothetical protein